MKWDSRGVSSVAWTVNSKNEKSYFQHVLKLPYITDDVGVDNSSPEQH